MKLNKNQSWKKWLLYTLIVCGSGYILEYIITGNVPDNVYHLGNLISLPLSLYTCFLVWKNYKPKSIFDINWKTTIEDYYRFSGKCPSCGMKLKVFLNKCPHCHSKL